MKKSLIALFLLFSVLASLTACGGGADPSLTVPENMRVGKVGDGYTLFVPEDWTVETSTGITMVYVSAVDHSNFTLITTKGVSDPIAYFESSVTELAAMLEDFSLIGENNNTLFGGKAAISRTYTGKLDGTEYKFKQYLCTVGDTLYLLTYTASTEIPSGEVTYFDRYEETVDSVVSNFLFEGTADAVTPEDKPVVKNEKGMILASDPAVSRYSLYVPESYTPVLQNGTTSASCGDAVLVLSYEIPTERTIDEYWTAKRAVYEKLYTDFAMVDAECSPPAEKLEDVKLWLGGKQAVSYVYTYTRGGVAYKTEKRMTIEGVYIYTLTYTARLTPSDGGTVPYTAHYADLTATAEAFTFD